MSSPGSNSGASQRASEITSAMLNVPGYADDSMLFMMRYGALAKVCYDLICDFFFFLSFVPLSFVWHYRNETHFHPPLPVSFLLVPFIITIKTPVLHIIVFFSFFLHSAVRRPAPPSKPSRKQSKHVRLTHLAFLVGRCSEERVLTVLPHPGWTGNRRRP